MRLLTTSMQFRARQPFAAVVAAIVAMSAGGFHPGHHRDRIVRDADALPYRLIEGRLADRFAHRPFRRAEDAAELDLLSLQVTASALQKRWLLRHDRAAGRKLGGAQLLIGDTAKAAALLSELLEYDSGRPNHLAAIHASRNAMLLTDLSAALLQRHGDMRALVVAMEAADRAWQLVRTPAAAWNRAVAAERLGFPEAAARLWHDALTAETSPDWKREAAKRREAVTRTIRTPAASPELFFHQHLIDHAAAGKSVHNLLPRDQLPTDVARNVSSVDRERLRSALQTFAHGHEAFARDDLTTACQAYADAERSLTALQSPLVLLVREQHLRCRCARAEAGCLDAIRALRAELLALRRYPWLAARTIYAEGQTLYRQGRIYDAARAFHTALDEFRAVGDDASAGLAHSVLGNTYDAAGEPEVSLEHHLSAIRLRFTYAGDRRRIQVEDAMLLLLRQGYVAAAELLLDELAATPALDGALVMEAALRGVIAFRRGETVMSERHFERAYSIAGRIGDVALRAEAKRSVLLAESGCGLGSARRRLGDIDVMARVAEQEEISLWLPRLLTERGIELEAANEPGRAEQDYLRAISILERREPRIDQSALTLGTSAERESAFDRTIRFYLKQHRIAAALAVAQRSTSLRISSLHARGTGVRDVFRSDANGSNGDAVDALRAMLPAGDVAIAQHLLSDRVITWIVTRSGIGAVQRRIPTEHLIDAVADLHSCASNGGCTNGLALERVSDLLLRDWIEHVPRGATLWLQSPLELQGVPFAMLKTRDGERLLSRNPLTNAPGFAAFVRAQQLDAARKGPLTAAFAAAGRPSGGLDPLPMAVREVTQAARFYAMAHTDTTARRGPFLQNASRTVTHFAGHVLVNDEQPLLSALAFNDGLLYMHELDRRTFAGVRLMVLSGCDTGRTPKPAMSVANALLHQDVPSVVSTLWPVDDGIAAQFAVAFHRAIAAGKSRAESLQLAVLTIARRQPDRPDAWAAFQLAGAPGPITLRRQGASHDNDG